MKKDFKEFNFSIDKDMLAKKDFDTTPFVTIYRNSNDADISIYLNGEIRFSTQYVMTAYNMDKYFFHITHTIYPTLERIIGICRGARKTIINNDENSFLAMVRTISMFLSCCSESINICRIQNILDIEGRQRPDIDTAKEYDVYVDVVDRGGPNDTKPRENLSTIEISHYDDSGNKEKDFIIFSDGEICFFENVIRFSLDNDGEEMFEVLMKLRKLVTLARFNQNRLEYLDNYIKYIIPKSRKILG
jgi:hypothetical protein